MKKFTLSLCLVTAFSLLVLPLATFAAYDSYTTDADSYIHMSDINATLTVDSGMEAELMVVSAENITLTMLANSNIMVRSSDRKEFRVTASGSDYGNQYAYLCGSSESSVEINAVDTRTWVITPLAATCGGGVGSGGGGGYSAPTVVTPTNASVSVNAGAASTRNRTVTLTLGATNASMMMISEKSDFSGASWVNYVASQSFTLSEGVGTKTVYVKYKSSTGGISSAVSDTVELLTALVEKVTQTVSATAGGSVALSDDSAGVTIPGGAASGNLSVSIEPTETYTAPATGLGVLGGQAFDFTATVDGAALTSFSKDVTLTFKYTDTQVKGLKESTLKVYYWSNTTSEWVLAGGVVNPFTNTVTVGVDHFTLFVVVGDKEFGSGDLVKLACDGTNTSVCSAVYYLGADGKRYVFPHEKIFLTWYDDFSTVKTISATDLASYTIGGNVTYKPGVRMIKIQSDPKVYAVGKNGVLHWVQSESVASALYGSTWNQYIDDLSDAFFFSYMIGSDVTVAADFDKSAVTAASPNVNTDKGL